MNSRFDDNQPHAASQLGQAVARAGVSEILETKRTLASATGGFHTVTQGENLGTIALRYGLSATELAIENEFGAGALLMPGQRIRIPQIETIAPASRELAAQYQVETGDTAISIARNFGIPITAFMRINSLTNETILFPGQTLLLSAPKEDPAKKSGSSPVEPNGSLSTSLQPASFVRAAPTSCLIHGFHKVGPHDTVSKLAAWHGVSTQALLSANDLGWNKALRIGSKVLIPIRHGAYDCPELIELPLAKFPVVSAFMAIGRELSVSEYCIVIALCLEMQLTGLDPQENASATARRIFGAQGATESQSSIGLSALQELETNSVAENLQSIGVNERDATLSAKFEPSAWYWLRLISKVQQN
jgi:LysM repeat protein